MPVHNSVVARGGWRIVFVLVHAAFMSMNVVALVDTVAERRITYPIHWEVSSERFGAIQWMDVCGTFGRLSLLAIGVYLTALMARGDRRVPEFYRWYGIALLAFDAVLSLADISLWVFPQGTSLVLSGLHLAVFAAMAGWVLFTSRSSTARAIFTREPLAMGPAHRMAIGLGALALVVWPFFLNNVVDVSRYLPAHITPMDSTAGLPFTQAMLTVSVAIGLFVLMKNAWQMRSRWIAVLLPMCFVAVILLFVLQSIRNYGFSAASGR